MRGPSRCPPVHRHRCGRGGVTGQPEQGKPWNISIWRIKDNVCVREKDIKVVQVLRFLKWERLKVLFIQKHCRGLNRFPARTCIIIRLDQLRNSCQRERETDSGRAEVTVKLAHGQPAQGKVKVSKLSNSLGQPHLCLLRHQIILSSNGR